MSSTMNGNIPVQNLVPASNSADFPGPRPSPSSVKNLRGQQDLQSSISNKKRSKSGRWQSGKQGHNPQHGLSKYPNVPISTSKDAVEGQPTTSSGSTGRIIGYKSSSSKSGGGKYRQRHQTNQLIEGMAPTTDFLESLSPTSSNRIADSNKSRHQTSRKINLSHLLNYKFEGRQRQSRLTSDNHGYKITNHYQREPRNYHKFNKQQFLQANCQFIVLNGHDYSIHKFDPDFPVDWDCIEEIRFKLVASTETICPICLEPPLAAKITKCGHIYCWTCMLQYLSLSDEKYRQCPLCFGSVKQNDLRSVISYPLADHSTGEEIVMRLMFRNKGCVDVEPYIYETSDNQTLNPGEEDSSANNRDHYSSRANLVIVDPNTVIEKITQRERDELTFKLELDRNEPEVCFVEEALEKLERRVDSLRSKMLSQSHKKVHDHVETSEARQTADKPVQPKSYLFYQSSDSQHIYLDSFCSKILCHEYGSLEQCPLEFRARILQMDWISMSDAGRKRFKYLEHLPLTCEVRLIEIDFENSGLVSRETLNLFEDSIKRRERERTRRLREEKKREKIIQIEQNRKIYGIQPSLKINLNNIEQFPSVSDGHLFDQKHSRSFTKSPVNEVSDEDDYSDSAQDSSVIVVQDINVPEKSDQPCAVQNLAEITMSFRDIQLQEEASINCSDSYLASTSWGTRKHGPAPIQSSFADLLVNAKTEQVAWTKRSQNSTSVMPNTSTLSAQNQRMFPGLNFEDDDEEIRLHPSEFTLSDFIDITAVPGKKKGKSKIAHKKG